MGHEHTGDCCGQHEQLNEIANRIENLGHLCMTGHCQHPEHQAAINLYDQQVAEFLAQENADRGPEKVEKRAKKSKKKPSLTFIQLLLGAAQTG